MSSMKPEQNLENLRRLVSEETSLEDILRMAGIFDSDEKCPDCGSPMYVYNSDKQVVHECKNCGRTEVEK